MFHNSLNSIVLSLEEALEIIQELDGFSPSLVLLEKKVKERFSREKIMGGEITPERRDEIEALLSSIKIRKVGFVQDKQYSTLGKLRASWLGECYRDHLKQYYILRKSTQWVWKIGYPIYVNYIATYLFNREQKRWRRLITLGEFVKQNNILTYKLTEQVTAVVAKPEVYPVSAQSLLDSTQNKYKFPEVFIAVINNAMVYGGTNLVLLEDEVICHDLYDFDRDYSSEELHNRTRIHAKTSRIRWLVYDKKPEAIDRAATFSDACATNYAHWMTEVMPRIVLFCANKKYEDIPIIVNEGLHDNIMESLYLVVGKNREIIILSTGRALEIKELYVTSVTGYVPFGRRDHKILNHSHGKFCPLAISALSRQLNELIIREADESYPEKVFLRRDSGIRKIANLTELEHFLVSKGYVVVETEKMSFLQQVHLFKNAKEIIAPTGAALVNAIFCKPGTHVIILMGMHEDMIYRYWCNMLAPIQLKVSYVLGDIVKNSDLGIHGDYFIDKKDVIELLEPS